MILSALLIGALLSTFWNASKAMALRNVVLKITHALGHAHICSWIWPIQESACKCKYPRCSMHSWVACGVLRSSALHVPTQFWLSWRHPIRSSDLSTVLSTNNHFLFYMCSFQCILRWIPAHTPECQEIVLQKHTFERLSDWPTLLCAVKARRKLGSLGDTSVARWIRAQGNCS